MIKCAFKQHPGYVIDQQEDVSGVIWDKIANFWPEDLEVPDIGKEGGHESCVAEVNGRPRFPTDSPENTLASSMYMIANMASFKEDDLMKIAVALKTSRELWDVTIPEGYVESIVSPKGQRGVEKYADANGDLPITSEDQFRESAELFLNNIKQWDVKDRILISHQLEKAANYYDCSEDYSFAWQKSNFAEEALMAREDFMRGLPKHSMCSEYVTKIASLRNRLSNTDDLVEIAKIAQNVNDLDRRADMNLLWGEYFPDPYNSIVQGIPKEAEEEIDYEGLRDIFEDEIVDQIIESPSTIIPTLPLQQRAIVEDYARQRSK